MVPKTDTKVFETRRTYKIKWERINLQKSLVDIVKGLILSGYEEDRKIVYDRAGSYYEVDFVHMKKLHIVELTEQHHRTEIGMKRIERRIKNLETAGWFVSRIP